MDDLPPLIPFITRVVGPTYDSWEEPPSTQQLGKLPGTALEKGIDGPVSLLLKHVGRCSRKRSTWLTVDTDKLRISIETTGNQLGSIHHVVKHGEPNNITRHGLDMA